MRTIDFGRKFFILFALILRAGSVWGEEKVFKLDDELSVREIEKDVYLVDHRYPWPANALLVRMGEKDFLLADTPYTNDAAKQLVEWMRGQFGEFNLTAVNTHFHRDNLGGNGYLLARKVPVYGSAMTVELLKKRGDAMLQMVQSPEQKKYKEGILRSPLVPPDHTFDIRQGMRLKLGDEEAVVDYPGPGHSPDNVVVYFPKRKILFGGCLIKAMDATGLGNLSDADVEKWPESVKFVLKKYPESRIVVPGHGAVGGMELVRHTLVLLETKAK